MDESELETSFSDILETFDEDKQANTELFKKLTEILPLASEISPVMFSPGELRGIAGQKGKIISEQMYILHIAYLRWKQNRKANESLPELIRLSIENIKPKIKENRQLLRRFIQKRLSEYSLMVSQFITCFISIYTVTF